MDSRDYELGLIEQKNSRATISASENMLKFYKENRESVEKAYEYYLGYSENVNAYVENVGKCSKEKAQKKAKHDIILVVTANDVERGIFERRLSELEAAKIKNFNVGEHFFQIVNRSKITIVHIHAAVGEDGAGHAIAAAMDIFRNIKIIVLLGICYGIDFKSQNIGDVAISNRVFVFRPDFRDGGNVEFVPVHDEHPDREWIGMIQNSLSYYKCRNYILSAEGGKIKTHIGKFLSANSLISDKVIKEKVLLAAGTARPLPVGGEMEANAIFHAGNRNQFSRWIIIKGIADWGEEKNGPDNKRALEFERLKDCCQAYAMTNATEMFFALINEGILWR